MNTYSNAYYTHRHERTTYSARTILSLLLEHIPVIQSAIDIGCGVGTWLSVLKEKGVDEVKGIDGVWVNQDLLEIPRECFMRADLSKTSIKLPQRYDLAITLEVAEHLPADLADDFVGSMAKLSDRVLFSAAIPFQGGRRHVNEQWQHYWVEKFCRLGYGVYDFIRPQIWTDKRIPYHYRQNILFFSRYPVPLHSIGTDTYRMPLDMVHPDQIAQMGIRGSSKLFLQSLRALIFRKIGAHDH